MTVGVASPLTAGQPDATTRVVVAFVGPIPANIEAELAARGAELERRDDLLHFVVARTANPQALLTWTNSTDPTVRFSEIPGSMSFADNRGPAEVDAATGSEFPNDPLYWKTAGSGYHQWALRMTHARDAWNITQGSANTLVAVIDTGVDHTHPDLSPNIARRLDGRVLGVDLRDGDDDPMDHFGHGTVVAGIIAAVTNNGVGIAGMTQSKIMPVRVADGLNANPQDSHLAATGIAWAAANGARVITASFRIDGDDSTLRLGIEYASRMGATIIAAAGNTHGGHVTRPAAFPETIAVSAVQPNGTVAAYAASGPEIDLSAPGGTGGTANHDDVLSLDLDGSYRFAWGTSYAVGFVAGTGALALSARPVLTAAQLRDALERSTVDAGPAGRDDIYGWGLLHSKRAVMRAIEIADAPPMPGNTGIQT